VVFPRTFIQLRLGESNFTGVGRRLALPDGAPALDGQAFDVGDNFADWHPN
jgi:hypothetical protein